MIIIALGGLLASFSIVGLVKVWDHATGASLVSQLADVVDVARLTTDRDRLDDAIGKTWSSLEALPNLGVEKAVIHCLHAEETVEERIAATMVGRMAAMDGMAGDDTATIEAIVMRIYGSGA